MKTFFPIAVLCVLLLFSVASAQESSAEQLQRQVEAQLHRLQSPRQQLHWEGDLLTATRSPWNGQGTWVSLRLLLRAGGEAELGLTEDQKERLSFLYLDGEIVGPLMMRMRENPTPEFIQKMEHARETMQAVQLPDDPLFERATEEQKNAFRDSIISQFSSVFIDLLQKEVEETLMPEQMLQVRKLEMQLMPAMGIPFPSMFEPLDLTGEQKEEMNQIADEMKAEFDRLTLEDAQLKSERLVATYGLLRDKFFASQEEFQQAMRDIHSQYVPTEAMRNRANDLREQGMKFMTLLQNRLMNVLMDEQLGRMQEILDATPDFVKQMIAEFNARQEEQAKMPTYTPGPDSWRPGMPLPVQFRENRRTGNFPRSE